MGGVVLCSCAQVKRKVSFETYRRSLSEQQVVGLTPGMLRPEDVPDDMPLAPAPAPAPAVAAP